MAINDVFLLDIVTTMGGQYAENVLGLQQTIAGPSEDPLILGSQAIQAFITSAQTALFACLGEDVSVIGYRCRRIHPTGGNTAFTPTPDGAGTAPSPSYSSATGACLLCSYYDTVALRYRTGRFFLPSAPQVYVSENSPVSDYVTAMTNLVAAFNTTIVSSPYTYRPGIWSRKTSIFYQSGEAETSWTYSGKLGTQRRRLKPAL